MELKFFSSFFHEKYQIYQLDKPLSAKLTEGVSYAA